MAFILQASLLVHLLRWPIGDERVGLGRNPQPQPRSDEWMRAAPVDSARRAD